jgi:ATP-dependent Clp protease adaptor protein ClpS
MSTATLPSLSPPIILPPHVVVLENDDDHTFAYVTEVLVKVFKYSVAEAQKITMDVHKNGEAVVWTGQKEIAELKAEQVTNFGPDRHSNKIVNYPLGVRVEPAS